MTARVIAVVALVAACGGGKHRPPGDPPTDPIPRRHADSCWWAGRLIVTVAPTRGDATCVQPRPIDVELEDQRPAPSTEAGLVISIPPVATGTSTDGFAVTINGEIDACPADLQITRQEPDGKRGTFVNIAAVQDHATGKVTGRGTARVFCNDDSCHCSAEVTLDGTIVPSD